MRRKKDGLRSKVSNVPKDSIVDESNGERYIPFCDLERHRGLIRREYVCESRECKYYHRLYILENHFKK